MKPGAETLPRPEKGPQQITFGEELELSEPPSPPSSERRKTLTITIEGSSLPSHLTTEIRPRANARQLTARIVRIIAIITDD